MSPTSDCLVFDTADLVPDAWRTSAGSGPVWAFNPALVRDGLGLIMAYRMILSDQVRRLAICRLDAALRVVAGSPQPISDRVRLDRNAGYPDVVHTWFADPRLHLWSDGLFLSWNSGWHEPVNHQFLHRLDPETLGPIGVPGELVLQGPRRPLEKNWMLFRHGSGETFCIYSVAPHRVLRVALDGTDAILCTDAATVDFALTAYPPSHGGLRGGAPPVLHDGRYWSFTHSVHDGQGGYRYEAAAYCFAAAPPFAPLAEPVVPLPLAVGRRGGRRLPRLNPAVESVVYPCGAVLDGDAWLVSHGIDDERCAITRIRHADVCATLRSVSAG